MDIGLSTLADHGTLRHPAQQIVLQDYVHAVQDAEARLDRLTRQIEELLPSWSMAPVARGRPGGGGHRGGRGRRLSPLRQCATADGLSWPGAVRAFVRSQHPAWWHHQGRQCSGPARADRRSLDLPHASRVSRKPHDRNEKLPPAIRDIAWEAQTRLCSRYRRLAAAGKPKVVVTTAIAREMVGFIWAIARIAQPTLQG